MKTSVLSLQSLLDLAIQAGGSVESVLNLAVTNGKQITGRLEPGTQIECSETISRDIVSYYRSKNLKPATYENPAGIFLTGIGNMTINENFIVA